MSHLGIGLLAGLFIGAIYGFGFGWFKGKQRGWNDCCKELKKLNRRSSEG